MSISLVIHPQNHRFDFKRDNTGEGNWVSLQRLGNSPAHSIVHLELQKELTEMAQILGYKERYNFARQRPQPVKEKTVRIRGVRKAKKSRSKKKESNLLGGFNPFNL